MHVGGNDMGAWSTKELLYRMKFALPGYTLIWGVRSYSLKIGGGGVIKHLDLDDGHKALFTPDETHLTFLWNGICINAIQGGIEQFLLYPNAKVFQAIKLSIRKCFNYYYNTQF